MSNKPENFVMPIVKSGERVSENGGQVLPFDNIFSNQKYS